MFLALQSYQIMAIVWAIFIVATAIIELSTSDLVIIWFTIGAVGALIAALFKAEIIPQLLIFAGVSLAFLIISRPMVKKFQQKEIIKTNADKIIGSYVTVEKEIQPNDCGEIKHEGKIWRAISNSNETINVGDKVLVEAISGTKVIVTKEKIEEKEVLL